MKKFKIADIELKNRYVQAPLAGYTSYAMRKLAYDAGASLTYTEMISASGIYYRNEKTIEMLPSKKEEGLLAVQLFGGDEKVLLDAIDYLENNEFYYDFLDFNFGCPVEKVIKQQAGSKYLTRPDAMYELLRKAVNKADEMKINYHVGNIVSSDVFYGANNATTKWAKMGVLAVEMEAFGLFYIARKLGREASCLMTVVDSLYDKRSLTSEEREQSLNQMIELALNSITL